MAALLACLRAVRAPVVHATNTTSVGLMPSAMRSSTRRTFTSFLGAGVGRSSASSDLAALWKPNRAFGISNSFGTRYVSTSTPLVSRMAGANGRWNVGAITSVAMLGLGLSLFVRNEEPVKCDTLPPPSSGYDRPREPLPPPPVSTVNVYELSFGTVCGICAGVFLKKGARALAFIFGGVFVLLQYFNSLSLVRVDWQRAGQRFEKLFYSPPLEPGGKPRPPTVSSVWNWFVNFLTADFQQRASFIAGFALGLRIG